MLTDLIMEENFEVKEEGPWYDKRDLEHDLHLAAELGKTLLERNHELEEGLQHMYSTNQEQQQEIEYLAKQVELLRQVNEQHAKVYEQLDAAARDLELGNHKLEQDKRSAQKRIHRLTETIDGLQVHLEELQIQVEELQVSPSIPTPALLEQRHLATQSVCCLQELYSSHLNRGTLRDDGLDDSAWLPTEMQRVEEEHAALQRSVSTLQAQLGAEQARRQEAEQEAELMVQEKGLLEQQVLELESSRGLDRVGQLEAELERLRQRWRAEAGGARKADARLVDALLFPLQEGAGLFTTFSGTHTRPCASQSPDSPTFLCTDFRTKQIPDEPSLRSLVPLTAPRKFIQERSEDRSAHRRAIAICSTKHSQQRNSHPSLGSGRSSS